MTDHIVAEDAWAADILYGTEPSSAPPTERGGGGEAAETSVDPEESGQHDDTVELDAAQEAGEPDANAAAKKMAMILGVGTLCAVAVTAAALRPFGDTAPAPQTPTPSGVPAPASPPQSAPIPPSNSDQAIPYKASANCPPGSTSAQALTDTTADSAWVCVRGPQDATVDGQVLHVDFGRSYVVAAVTVTPGWVAKISGGNDEWLQHRVVSRLQYVFNDTDRTVVTQDTANIHGPVTIALPRKVLASGATVSILQTSRPPASPLPATEPNTLDSLGFGDSLLGPDGAPLLPDVTSSTDQLQIGGQGYDPVDATFAMSQLTFVGHEPN